MCVGEKEENDSTKENGKTIFKGGQVDVPFSVVNTHTFGGRAAKQCFILPKGSNFEFGV